MNFLFSSAPEGKNRLKIGIDWVQSRLSADGVARDTSQRHKRRILRRPTAIPQHDIRKISFSGVPTTHMTMSLVHYSQEEFSGTFYSRDDLSGMLDRTFKIVAQIEDGDVDPRVCTRGLEKMSGERQRLCHEIRRKAIDTVMDEQEEQWANGIDNLERIAEMLIAISREARARALRDARQDIYAASSYLGTPAQVLSLGNGGRDKRVQAASILKHSDDIIPTQTIRERRAPAISKSGPQGKLPTRRVNSDFHTPKRNDRRKVELPEERMTPIRTKSLPLNQSDGPQTPGRMEQRTKMRRNRADQSPGALLITPKGNMRRTLDSGRQISPSRTGSLPLKSGEGSCTQGTTDRARVRENRPRSSPDRESSGLEMFATPKSNGKRSVDVGRSAPKHIASMPIQNDEASLTPGQVNRTKLRKNRADRSPGPLLDNRRNERGTADICRRISPTRIGSLPLNTGDGPQAPRRSRSKVRRHVDDKSPGRRPAVNHHVTLKRGERRTPPVSVDQQAGPTRARSLARKTNEGPQTHLRSRSRGRRLRAVEGPTAGIYDGDTDAVPNNTPPRRTKSAPLGVAAGQPKRQGELRRARLH